MTTYDGCCDPRPHGVLLLWESLRRRQPIRQDRPRSCHRAVKYSRLATGRIPTLDTKYPVLSCNQLSQYHMSQAQNTQLLRFYPPAFSLPPQLFRPSLLRSFPIFPVHCHSQCSPLCVLPAARLWPAMPTCAPWSSVPDMPRPGPTCPRVLL